MLALNKSWCPHCFTCDKCGSELVNMGFVELNGKIYCENDYETFFAPKCAKCRQPIVGVSDRQEASPIAYEIGFRPSPTRPSSPIYIGSVFCLISIARNSLVKQPSL